MTESRHFTPVAIGLALAIQLVIVIAYGYYYQNYQSEQFSVCSLSEEKAQ